MDHLAAWDKFADLTYDDLPEDVVKVANQCILDWFGCALAGSNEPLSEILRNQFGHRAGQCTVIGSELKLEAPTAALLNGAAGHALDYDDTGSSVGCHSTAPVIPAVLAVAEEIGASGKALIAAFVVGVEIEGPHQSRDGTRPLPAWLAHHRHIRHVRSHRCCCASPSAAERSVRHSDGPGCVTRWRRESKFRHHDKTLSPRQIC